MTVLKLKQLESYLGGLSQFESPKIELEQYPTGAHIGSRMIYTIENSFGDLEGCSVADLGCGCGTLAIGCAMMGAEYVVGFDVDKDSIILAKENCEEYEVEVDFVLGDLSQLRLRGPIVDTVVMNPPFGTRRKGADLEFLELATKIARNAVYSLHKSSTREHIMRVATKEFGVKKAEVLSQLRYDIPAMYKFHRRKEVDIEVDFWRFEL